ncbi:MAG: hypothetical protein OXN90_08825, partial [Gemmatimonadota bacterium]|nr:hypothetical protein [Gemmatimonadota bacterium]
DHGYRHGYCSHRGCDGYVEEYRDHRRHHKRDREYDHRRCDHGYRHGYCSHRGCDGYVVEYRYRGHYHLSDKEKMVLIGGVLLIGAVLNAAQ